MNLLRPNVFEKRGRWYKGALHMHTTRSDGGIDPQGVLTLYRRRGYDFICFGDHWTVTAPQDPQGKLLVIPGCELHTWAAGVGRQIYDVHVMCVGADECPPLPQDLDQRYPPQRLWQLAQEISEYCVLAHPGWSTMGDEQIRALGEVGALEVFNRNCERDGLGHAEYVWDLLLNQGCRVDALAVDDAHWVESEDDSICGFVMVKAPACTREAIVAAMKAGDFYSSTGPLIESVRFDGRDVDIRCSEAVSVLLRGNRFYSTVLRPDPGGTFRKAFGQVGRRVEFLRIEVTDTAGRKAWSNPFYLEP